jgi:selenide,water dikinase
VLAGGNAAAKDAAIVGMRQLNRQAAEALSRLPYEHVHAVTDVTGFGLAGHGWEMAERSAVEMVFEDATLPLYPSVRSLVTAGVKTGGEDRNRSYVGSRLVAGNSGGETIILDPQTSGGLLASVAPSAATALMESGWWKIGEVRAGPARVSLI